MPKPRILRYRLLRSSPSSSAVRVTFQPDRLVFEQYLVHVALAELIAE